MGQPAARGSLAPLPFQRPLRRGACRGDRDACRQRRTLQPAPRGPGSVSPVPLRGWPSPREAWAVRLGNSVRRARGDGGSSSPRQRKGPHKGQSEGRGGVCTVKGPSPGTPLPGQRRAPGRTGSSALPFSS